MTGGRPRHRGARPDGAANGSARRLVHAALGLLLVSLAGLLWGLLDWETAYRPLALSVGGCLGILVWLEWKRCGHPLTPAGVLALGGLLIFFVRPLAIADVGLTSPGALLDTRVFAGARVGAGTTALLQVLLFVLVFGLLYLHTLSRRRGAELPSTRLSATGGHVSRAGVVLAAAVAVDVGCVVLLIESSGGLAAHLGGVSVRSQFLAGRYLFTLGYVPLAVALVVYVLVRRHSGAVPAWDAFARASAVLLIVSAFLTGGRGPLVLGAIVPLLILKQLGSRPLRAPALVAGGLVMVGGAMVMSIFLRENVYSEGAAARDLADRPVETLVTRLTSGQEARPFDSLILLNERHQAGDLAWQHGRTYLAVPTWFVPGSMLSEDKGGANTWFTKTYVPRFYYPTRTETSLSAVGESFANFGWLGVATVGGALGVAAGRFSAWQLSSVRRQAVAVLTTPLFFSFLRGDAYQNLSLGLLILGLVFAATAVVAPSGGTSPRRVDDRARRRGALSAPASHS